MDAITLVDVLVAVVQVACGGLIAWGALLALGFGRRREDYAAREPERAKALSHDLRTGAGDPPASPA
jgi:hypothetical protein